MCFDFDLYHNDQSQARGNPVCDLSPVGEGESSSPVGDKSV